MSLRPHSGKLVFTSRPGWVLILSFVDKHVGRTLGGARQSPSLRGHKHLWLRGHGV